MGVNRSTPEQFQLRLPMGLRDRVKAHAERHGRSTNAEIVRVLEREFPAPKPVEERVLEVLDLIGVLTLGPPSGGTVRIVEEIEAMLKRMAGGQVSDIDPELQSKIRWQLEMLSERRLGDVGEEPSIPK
ncbi:MAG: Arc family DNA-binding protein [Candidatus Kaistia colombiensis]|nr:MAG: Arc family DNA-binding protein [Kaistia sp.]